MPRDAGKKPATASRQAGAAARGRAGATGAKGAAGAPKKKRAGVRSTRLKDRARLSSRMSRKRRMSLFIRSTAIDFLLVLLVSAALTFTVSYAFHSAWDYRGNPLLIVLMTIPTLLALYVGTWSKRAVLPSALLAFAYGVAMMVFAVAISPEGFIDASGGVADTEGSYGVFAIVAFVVPVVVFLLLFSVLAAGLVQFLYREWATEQPGVPAAIVMLFGIGMLFVYECYKQSVYTARRVKRTSFGGAFAFSALIGAVCVLVGAGVFYGVLVACAPNTPDVKLFEEYVSPPVADQAKDYEKSEVRGDQTTDNTGDDADETNDDGEGGQADDPQAGTGTLGETILGQLAMSVAGVNPDAADDQANQSAMHLAIQILWVLRVALAVALVAGFLAFWRYRRTLRLKRIAKLSNAYQVYFLYHFLLERFRRVRIAKPAHLTPVEFAVNFAKPMYTYTRGTDGVDFIEVTLLYEDAVFGGRAPADAEVERVRGYYRAFYRNAFKATALPKWVFWRFWRL